MPTGNVAEDNDDDNDDDGDKGNDDAKASQITYRQLSLNGHLYKVTKSKNDSAFCY